jgi:sec-independent protein translocase protein TatC
MTVIEHLDEFRYRLIVSLAAIVVGAVIAYIFYVPILKFLKGPLDQTGRVGGVEIRDIPLFAPGITGPFLLRIKVSFFAGLLAALPVTLFQFWRFITPGLYANEKKYAIPFVASSVALFALGTWFAFLVLPVGIKFLLGFVVTGIQQPFILFPDYINFLTLMVLAFGITFEFPLLLVFLAGVGLVTSARLRRYRRHAIVIIAIVAAFATPSQDPFSQFAMAAPLYILFELSILVIRFAMKK